MYIDKFREVINSSTHNIPERLRMIDKDYFLVRNHQTNKFEVHHSKQPGSTFCLSIPYPELDERTVQMVRETRIEYIDNIMNEIERSNAKLESDQDKQLKDVNEVVCKDIFKYVKAHESKEFIDMDSKYFEEVLG